MTLPPDIPARQRPAAHLKPSTILACARAVARASVFEVLDELEIAIPDDKFDQLVERLAKKNNDRLPAKWDQMPLDALWLHLNPKPRAQR
jgi:hypothetical protein